MRPAPGDDVSNILPNAKCSDLKCSNFNVGLLQGRTHSVSVRLDIQGQLHSFMNALRRSEDALKTTLNLGEIQLARPRALGFALDHNTKPPPVYQAGPSQSFEWGVSHFAI